MAAAAADNVQVLVAAGSDPALLQLTTDDSTNKAPIELMGEFLRCLMTEEYDAAKVLCNKVLELESSNLVAKELVSTIDERIRLNDELDTESSSSEDSDSTSNSSESNEEGEEEEGEVAVGYHRHTHCHGNHDT